MRRFLLRRPVAGTVGSTAVIASVVVFVLAVGGPSPRAVSAQKLLGEEALHEHPVAPTASELAFAYPLALLSARTADTARSPAALDLGAYHGTPVPPGFVGVP